MKTLIILLLLTVAVAGAFWSKPNSDPGKHFKHYLMSHDGYSEADAGKTAAQYDYLDRIIWIDAKDRTTGEIVSTCVFRKWFNHGEIKHIASEDVKTIERAVK